MLGKTLPSGSDAISFHNTLFRVSELCWIKAVRLSPLELGVRIAAGLLAVAWVFAMKAAKGTYYNVEFLLGLFPLVLAWVTSPSLRIGCSGDFEESYEERRGTRSGVFVGWIETLRSKEPNWFHLQGGSYDVLLNLARVAWVRPCVQWQSYPLVVVAVFVGYLYLLGLSLDLGNTPVIEDFQILIFEGSSGTVRFLSYLVILVALLAFGASLKRSVEVCGTGGVQDTFPISPQDQGRLFALLSGQTAPEPVKSEPRAGKVTTVEVPVAKSAVKPVAKAVEEPVNVSSETAPAEP